MSSRGAVLFAAAVAAELVLVKAASQHGDFTRAGEALRFVPLILLAGAAFLCAMRWFREVPPALHARTLWAIAIALRAAMLACAPGDDFWRHPWEGRVLLAGHNPYALSPAAPELQELRDDNWARINHPEVAAIYPPGAQLIFAALSAVSTSPAFFKLVFIAADLLTLALLLRLVHASAAAWYAWNPAVVYAFAGAAHFDSLMLLALTGAAWTLHRAEGRLGWQIVSVSCLGAAVALKVIPVFLLPVWAFALGAHAWLLAVSIAVPAVLTIPFGGIRVVLDPLRAFADVTRFNELLVWIFPNPWQRNWPVTLLLGATALGLAWHLRRDWRRSALWVFGAALILSPVLHPWYVTWILPFAVWRQQPAWTVLSLSALAALLLWESTPLWTAWQPNLLTRALVCVPPLIAWRWPSAFRVPPSAFP